jgi:hypothetical protein
MLLDLRKKQIPSDNISSPTMKPMRTQLVNDAPRRFACHFRYKLIAQSFHSLGPSLRAWLWKLWGRRANQVWLD